MASGTRSSPSTISVGGGARQHQEALLAALGVVSGVLTSPGSSTWMVMPKSEALASGSESKKRPQPGAACHGAAVALTTNHGSVGVPGARSRSCRRLRSRPMPPSAPPYRRRRPSAARPRDARRGARGGGPGVDRRRLQRQPRPGRMGRDRRGPDGAEPVELSGGETHTTNNRMEYTAALEGLRSLPAGRRPASSPTRG